MVNSSMKIEDKASILILSEEKKARPGNWTPFGFEELRLELRTFPGNSWGKTNA